MRILGVNELWEADDDLCPLFPNEGARGVVNGILNSVGGERFINPNQYENYLNVHAHYTTTGPEIWRQTQGEVDYFFAALGTCGTITGIGKYLKEKKPSVKIIGIEPSLPNHNIPGMKKITGLPEELKPAILAHRVSVLLIGYDAVAKQVKMVKKDIAQHSKSYPIIEYWKDIPGVGPIRAITLFGNIGSDISEKVTGLNRGTANVYYYKETRFGKKLR